MLTFNAVNDNATPKDATMLSLNYENMEDRVEMTDDDNHACGWIEYDCTSIEQDITAIGRWVYIDPASGHRSNWHSLEAAEFAALAHIANLKAAGKFHLNR